MTDTKVKRESSFDKWTDYLQRGETDWLNQFYEQNRNSFLQWGETNHNLEKDELLDIYQNAMIILYENIKHNRIKDLQSSVVTYLYGIAKNLIYKYHKRNELINRHEYRLSEHYHFLATDKNEMESKYQVVSKALMKMEEPCKSILSLFYVNGMKLPEILKKMKYSSLDVVKTQKSRCLKRLKELIK